MNKLLVQGLRCAVYNADATDGSLCACGVTHTRHSSCYMVVITVTFDLVHMAVLACAALHS
jgi:hypothetical protein